MIAEIKLTKTMLEKHIIDANKSVRELVKPMGVDNEAMKYINKKKLDAIYSDGTVTKLKMLEQIEEYQLKVLRHTQI